MKKIYREKFAIYKGFSLARGVDNTAYHLRNSNCLGSGYNQKTQGKTESSAWCICVLLEWR